eukprot:TRINITY_DN1670_c0_g1_i3.p1 TRINITY_DN1670_c0_g1~~TRINITY_DN1670_c0_g1_i3.p1  ORF type:complete len:248 (-),score=67.46 TRINITY_DN1670_c0_g1_i3:145-888(-)
MTPSNFIVVALPVITIDLLINNLFTNSTKLNPLRVPKKPAVQGKPESAKGAQKHNICCNCKKSQCLKLYCECFSNKQYCQGCNCVNCANTKENKTERDKAMRATLERNPTAFDPKILHESTAGVHSSLLRHTRGCHCKKSGCQKKYCECYQSGARCNELCKCEECKNMGEESVVLAKERNTPLVGGKRRQTDKDKSGEKTAAPKRVMSRIRKLSAKGLALARESGGKRGKAKSNYVTRASKKAIVNQ